MNIKERRLLTKIYRTHHNLLNRLSLGDKEYWNVVKKYSEYHNELNNKILQLEIAKRETQVLNESKEL